jgi:hypothetical protein
LFGFSDEAPFYFHVINGIFNATPQNFFAFPSGASARENLVCQVQECST